MFRREMCFLVFICKILLHLISFFWSLIIDFSILSGILSFPFSQRHPTPPSPFHSIHRNICYCVFLLKGVYRVIIALSNSLSLSFSLCPHYHVIILISHITFNTQIQKAAMKDTEDITKLSNNLMQFGISSYCYLLVFRLVFLPCYFSLC